MDYEINKCRKDLYLPMLKYWIHDTFGTNLTESMIYNLILREGFLTWTSDYIADCVYCTGKTVKLAVKKLCDLGIVKKILIPYGTKKKWVLVSIYTEEGRRTDEEIKQLIIKGCRTFRIFQKRKEAVDLDKWLEKEIIPKRCF